MSYENTVFNAPLPKPLRTQLENTVKAAREVAEKAGKAALEQLAVAEPKVPDYLDEPQRVLRRKLRAHARAISANSSQNNSIELQGLVWEVAYEHWHRMLFARFLAESGLLMWEPGAAVSLDDCRDMVDNHPEMAMGAKSHWELAGKLAARMLPQVFRPNSPVFDLAFAPESQRELELLLTSLPEESFSATDSLGWAYQFWQAKRKLEINEQEVKIGAAELPAVTQLFTEPYMVEYILHNTVGAWWQTRCPGIPSPVELTYLRLLSDGTPAAGKFNEWPNDFSNFKLLDPCCGSGHFLVGAFHLLVPMRMESEGLTATDAVNAVLADNLHGLEIDPRCVEVAAFALALAAWRYPEAGGYRSLPAISVACAGLPITAKKEDWLALAAGNQNLHGALDILYTQFKDAPILGSLIDFNRGLTDESLFSVPWSDIQPVITEILSQEYREEIESSEISVVAQGISKAAELLSFKYHLLVTNPPYLVRGKQSELLQKYLTEYYKFGDADIATVFLKRFEGFLHHGGVHASVTPLNWYFLKSYKDLRLDLLKNMSVNHIVKVGSGATAKASWDVLRALAIVTNRRPSDGDLITGVEAVTSNEESRAMELRRNVVSYATLQQVRASPDSKFVLDIDETLPLLQERATSFAGLQSGDFLRFGRKFWEIQFPNPDWELQQSTFESSNFFTGLEDIIFWERGEGALSVHHSARLQGFSAHQKLGVVITQTRTLPATLYRGGFFDNNVAVLVPSGDTSIEALWSYCSSPNFNKNVRKLDEKLGVTNATLAKVPFDTDYWSEIGASEYPNGLPKPFSNSSFQWIFHGNPQPSEDALHVAVARLLGYLWPAEVDGKMELSKEARAYIAGCKSLYKHVDDDGIVCLQAVRGEQPAHERLLALLIDAWETVSPGSWTPSVLDKLLAQADNAGKGLAVWLRDSFFEQHAKRFGHRPFIWHVWDGQKDGFAALVNAHKLDAKNLERLIHTYLGDWIRTQEAGVASGVDGAPLRLSAAQNLKTRLQAILEGEAPYDIFVRWKPLAEQAVGWNPDLNDGVRMNIRPFMTAEVLRHNKKPKLNITWDKDRGKDVESAPWFKVFGGDRINDHHLNLAEKIASRDKK